MKRRYGDALVHSLGLDTSPLLTTHSLRDQQIASTHFICGSEQIGLAEPIHTEDTFITSITLRDLPYHELWSKGYPTITGRFTANSMWTFNLADEFRVRVFHPYEAVSFYMPRASLDCIADEEGIRRVVDISYPHGTFDLAIASLANALLPTFDNPQEASPLFIDQVMLAVGCRLLEQYGDSVHVSPARTRDGLTPTQVCRAKEMLANNLKGDMLVADMARECGLSRQRFFSAFRKTIGCTPHQWLQQQRVDQAKNMLKNTALPIEKIALLCGFTDASHFTKVFVSLVGKIPTVWRQQIRDWIN